MYMKIEDEDGNLVDVTQLTVSEIVSEMNQIHPGKTVEMHIPLADIVGAAAAAEAAVPPLSELLERTTASFDEFMRQIPTEPDPYV